MQIEVMELSNIDRIVPMYMDYYDNYEDGCWPQETASRRILRGAAGSKG